MIIGKSRWTSRGYRLETAQALEDLFCGGDPGTGHLRNLMFSRVLEMAQHWLNAVSHEAHRRVHRHDHRLT